MYTNTFKLPNHTCLLEFNAANEVTNLVSNMIQVVHFWSCSPRIINLYTTLACNGIHHL